MSLYSKPLKTASIIGLSAMSGALFAFGINLKDWRIVSSFASIGCFISGQLLNLKTLNYKPN